jgi:hypothetical protein
VLKFFPLSCHCAPVFKGKTHCLDLIQQAGLSIKQHALRVGLQQ